MNYFFKSFLNLISLRFISRAIPILMSGYIIKNTGIHSFGKLEFAKTLNYFFKLIIAYGFIYSVPAYFYGFKKEEIIEKIPQYLGSILLIRLILTIFCFILLSLILYISPVINADRSIILSFFLVAISSGFLPICVYQVLEKLHVITIFNSLTKFFFYLSIPFYINSEADVKYYPIIYSIVEFARLICTYLILFFFYKIRISPPKLSIVKRLLMDSFSGFCFSFYMFFNNSFPIIFLRIFSGSLYVGIYRLGYSVLNLCQQVIEPFIQCFYPVIKIKFKKDINYGMKLSLKVLLLNIVLSSITGFLCFIFSSKIIIFFCSNDIIYNNSILFNDAVFILKLNIFIFLCSVVSSFIGMQIFAVLGYKYLYTILLFIGGAISISLHFLFVPKYNSVGASLSVLIGELFVFFSILILFFSIFNKKTKLID